MYDITALPSVYSPPLGGNFYEIKPHANIARRLACRTVLDDLNASLVTPLPHGPVTLSVLMTGVLAIHAESPVQETVKEVMASNPGLFSVNVTDTGVAATIQKIALALFNAQFVRDEGCRILGQTTHPNDTTVGYALRSREGDQAADDFERAKLGPSQIIPYLRNQMGYHRVETPQDGDLVLYIGESKTVTLAGVYRGAGLVDSKRDYGPDVLQHPIGDDCTDRIRALILIMRKEKRSPA
jgi:hypothetical protein